MISVKDAGRLLQQDWKNPVELARELYSQVVSKGPKLVESTIEIAVPNGVPALKLTRALVALAAPVPSPTPVRPATRPAPPFPAAPKKPSSTINYVDYRKLPTNPTSNSRFRKASESLKRAATVALRTTIAVAAPRPPSPAAKVVPSQGNPRQVQSGPASSPAPAAPRLDPGPAQFRSPYVAPLLEVHGEARFSGPAPVQFEQRPLLFNPIKGEYEELGPIPGTTKIPRESPFDYWFGKVTKAAGENYDGLPLYKCDIFQFPNSDTEDNVVVTMWGLDKFNQLDEGTLIWPINQSPEDGSFYCTPDNCNERLAKTTSLITERVGLVAGTGTAQIYTMTVPKQSKVGTFVANPKGDVQVYSISGKPAAGVGTIAIGTWIVIRKIFNYWHIVAADCSGAV